MKLITYFPLIATLFILQACSSSSAAKQELNTPIHAQGPYNSSLAGAANTAPDNATVPDLCDGANDTNLANFSAEVIRLTNLERAKAGLGALTSQPELTQAAQKHSIDMGCNFFLSHTGSDGTSPFDRMDAFGYFYAWAGENIAAGHPTPADVMNGWMNSSGHRDNILNPNYTEIGIGYVYNPKDTVKHYYHYWTMTLGSQ